jgi:hypothetical protein
MKNDDATTLTFFLSYSLALFRTNNNNSTTKTALLTRDRIRIIISKCVYADTKLLLRSLWSSVCDGFEIYFITSPPSQQLFTHPHAYSSRSERECECEGRKHFCEKGFLISQKNSSFLECFFVNRYEMNTFVRERKSEPEQRKIK